MALGEWDSIIPPVHNQTAAHKTIALTTELRELNRFVAKNRPRSANKTSRAGAAGGKQRMED